MKQYRVGCKEEESAITTKAETAREAIYKCFGRMSLVMTHSGEGTANNPYRYSNEEKTLHFIVVCW